MVIISLIVQMHTVIMVVKILDELFNTAKYVVKYSLWLVSYLSNNYWTTCPEGDDEVRQRYFIRYI